MNLIEEKESLVNIYYDLLGQKRLAGKNFYQQQEELKGWFTVDEIMLLHEALKAKKSVFLTHNFLQTNG